MINLKKLGAVCKDLRKSHKVTLQEIGSTINRSRKTIWDFENGGNDSVKIFCAYITVLKPTPDELRSIINECTTDTTVITR